jgi:membrane protease YdiL (CAAX protease family)
MKPLPRLDYTPSANAGLALAAAALLLVPLDMALWERFMVQPQLHPPRTRFGKALPPRDNADWIGPLRLALPALAVGYLLLSGRVTRRDVGLALGRPRVTLFWVGFPGLVLADVFLLAGLLGVVVVRFLGWSSPGEWFGPHLLSDESNFLSALWATCVLVPLHEELVYRGVLVPGLERLGGTRLALAGTGVVWTALHFLYGWYWWWMPFYALSGALMAWVFLRSRSLVAVVALHSLQLLGALLLDLVTLRYGHVLYPLLAPE